MGILLRMTITFENHNDVIGYALETTISYPRNNHYIVLAQSVWCMSSIIGLQKGLIAHIDCLSIRSNIGNLEVQGDSTEQSRLPNVHPSRIEKVQNLDSDYDTSEHESISTTETDIHNEVINNC
jgi:hypothetical protein